MRLIGNKTHGDLAEIAISEFINQYMYDFKSDHVGKKYFRSKKHEEDITIINEITKEKFPVSLKAYGNGDLQLSTDKNFHLYPRLQQEGTHITDKNRIKKIFEDEAFQEFSHINVLPLIYNEKEKKCNILVFDYKKAIESTTSIKLVKKRIHSPYTFYDKDEKYICEVRYGNATANALQRGLWTNTKSGINYFDSITNGWIDYSHNIVLIDLFSHALVSTSKSHEEALEKIKIGIAELKRKNNL